MQKKRDNEVTFTAKGDERHCRCTRDAAREIDSESVASELARHAAAREIGSESAASDEVKPCHVRGLNPKQ